MNPKDGIFESLTRCLTCQLSLNFHLRLEMSFRKDMNHPIRAKTRARKDSVASSTTCLGLFLKTLSLEVSSVKMVSGREAIPERLERERSPEEGRSSVWVGRLRDAETRGCVRESGRSKGWTTVGSSERKEKISQ